MWSEGRDEAGGEGSLRAATDKGVGTGSASCTCRMSCGFLPRSRRPSPLATNGFHEQGCDPATTTTYSYHHFRFFLIDR